MTEQLATIPSIAERCHQNCNACSFYVSTYEFDYCILATELNYNMIGERTSLCNNRYSLTDPVIKPLPCRFHLTPDELKQILDPYFME